MEQQIKEIEIINRLIEKENYSDALRKAKHILVKGVKDKSQIAYLNKIIGKLYFEMQRFSEAKPFLSKAITLYQKQNNIDEKVNTQSILATSLAKSAEYEESMKMFEEVAIYQKSENNNLEVAKALGNIATVYSLLHDFELAIKTYKDCLEFINKSDDKNALAMALYNLGENYMYINDFSNSTKFLNEAIKVGIINCDINIQARAFDCLAGVYFQQNNPELALENEEKACDLLINSSDKRLYSNVQLNKSRILFTMNKLDESLEIIESVFAEAKKIKDQKSLFKYHELKSKIYEKAENFEDAFYSKVECSKIEQKQFNIERLKIIEEGKEKANRLMIELKNEQKEKEFLILKNKKDLLDKELTYKALQIVQKNELIMTIMNSLENLNTKNPRNVKIIKDIVESISIDTASQNVWAEFEKWFTEVHKDFFGNLSEIVPKLSNRYRQLAAFIKLGLRSKEISLLMGISKESVEKYRIRFRKKLNLSTGDNLFSFINKL